MHRRISAKVLPKNRPIAVDAAQVLANFIAGNGMLTVLGGAGVSTASGIPDYRDRHGNSRVSKPIQFPDFVGSASTRQRYWARSFAGWQRFSDARPNAAHEALAQLEAIGKLDTLLTQNVDGLHQAAGSRRVIELHGRLSEVVCLECHGKSPRPGFQRRLGEANPDWHAVAGGTLPDGDTSMADAEIESFRVPGCEGCGGILKPDVVMFGENVPKSRVNRAIAAVERSDALLIVGSSLAVYSGYRFAKLAAASGKPLLILNQGLTRADDLADIKLEADCARVLPDAVRRIIS